VHDVEKIIEKGDSTKDPILQDGDTIFVPKTWFRIK